MGHNCVDIPPDSGFLPEICLGGEINWYVNFYCHANFSIVSDKTVGRGQTAWGGDTPCSLCGRKLAGPGVDTLCKILQIC